MWTEKVDLHCHSRHSDGIHTPTEMASRAYDSGVRGWSLTDHDTNTGWKEAQLACDSLGMRFIPGVEITCEVEITRFGVREEDTLFGNTEITIE